MDLYYLMDLTWSMKDDKETLVGLGWKMANTLGTFTTNFRLGFGSYADKPLMPYIFPKHEENPCKSENAVCKPLYSFWHHLELTDNIPRFIHEVCLIYILIFLLIYYLISATHKDSKIYKHDIKFINL